MILVDTSVWVEHLRRGLPRLATLLQEGEVLIHPWVIGELACGNLRNRQQLLKLLQGLPAATVASDAEVLQLIEGDQLMGRGCLERRCIASQIKGPSLPPSRSPLPQRRRERGAAAASCGAHGCPPGANRLSGRRCRTA